MLDQVKLFENSFANQNEQSLKFKNGTPIEKAIFLYQYTLQFYYDFSIKLSKSLTELGRHNDWKLKISMKENLLRIEQKIKSYNLEHDTEEGWRYMKDMIRATVIVFSPNELLEAYNWFKAFVDGERNILTLKNNLGSDLQNINITFNYE